MKVTQILAGLLGILGPAMAHAETKLVLVDGFHAADRLNAAVATLADDITTATGGEVKVTAMQSAAAGGRLESSNGMNTRDGVIAGGAPLLNIDPAYDASRLPFRFDGRDDLFAQLDGQLGAQIAAPFLALGFTPIAWLDGGCMAVLSISDDVADPGTVKKGFLYDGRYSSGVSAEIMSQGRDLHNAELGSPMAANQLASDRPGSAGLIGPIEVLNDPALLAVGKTLTVTRHECGLLPIVISTSVLDGLDPQQADAIRKAGAELAAAQRQEAVAAEEAALAAMREAGVRIVDEIDREAWMAAVNDDNESFLRNNGLGGAGGYTPTDTTSPQSSGKTKGR